MRASAAVRLAALVTILSACATPPVATAPASAPAPGSPEPTATPVASASRTAGPSPESERLAWTQIPASGPAAREDHTWTVDPSSGIAYLFGGRDGATVFGDTWAYDPAADTWAELAPPTSPPPRFGHEAAWVDRIGLVIFAGQAGSAFFGDLWAFDPAGVAWSQLPASGALPTPRYGSCAAVGPDGRLWISHGFTQDQVRFSDTRAYDFGTGAWTDETPVAGARPVERCLHGCWWTDEGELSLYAGQTTGTLALDDRWVLAAGAWARIDGTLPAARNLYARARTDDATLVFGGQSVDGAYLDDLWLLRDDQADAEPIEPVGDGPGPAGRAGAELVIDAARDRVLLFGGLNAEGALDDLWSLAGL